MVRTVSIGNRLFTAIPLSVAPDFCSSSTITASTTSKHAGTVIHGFFKARYLLPNGDHLLLIANHNSEATQLMLITKDPEKIRQLPGKRCASIVADTISQLNRYRIRAENYPKPYSKAESKKYCFVTDAIEKLELLLEQERNLSVRDWEGQETLRRNIIEILEECRDRNRELTIDPTVSEGHLGLILYNARKSVQHYQFNRLYPVCRTDQLDFTQEKSDQEKSDTDKPISYVWDSELYIGHDEEALQDTIRIICKQYHLDLGENLSIIPSSRFARFGVFIKTVLSNCTEFINYLASPIKPPQYSETKRLINAGLTITDVKPYYHLEGLEQKAHTEEEVKAFERERVSFFEYEGSYYPKPSGDDLVTICDLSSKHLYVDQRIRLQFKFFIFRIPAFFAFMYRGISFICHELYQDFWNHIHSSHSKPWLEEKHTKKQITPSANYLSKSLNYISDILRKEGYITEPGTLENFISQQLKDNNFVLVREKHPPSPPTYDNLLHRSLEAARHVSGYFSDVCERDPIIGTIAMAAYIFGAGAIIAPDSLTALLTKLRLKGLIAAIEPTQALARWMSHGTTSEAISAAVTYWQAAVIGGDLDKFFIEAVKLVKDRPAELAIITSLAIMLGFGLCQVFPDLQEEMGEFPYINYAVLGLKGGIAINDTIMHPGDDWLLGTIKWLIKGGLTTSKFLLGPIIEGRYYGFDGFLSGVGKSGYLLKRTIKQLSAALIDFILAVLTMPLLEFSTIIHVPFRGITNFLIKTFAILGNWQSLGKFVLDFSPTSFFNNYFSNFRLSPLYGFYSPFGRYAKNKWLNIPLNILMLVISTPLQLCKNLLILPFIDLCSLVIRSLLTIAHPLVKLLTFVIGNSLTGAGFIWDKSVGLIFKLAAQAVMTGANLIDYHSRQANLFLLGKIQVLRLTIHHWAFEKEDYLQHTINDDRKFLIAHPEILEKIVSHNHDKSEESTQCMLQLLIGDTTDDQRHNVVKSTDFNYYGPVFSNEPQCFRGPHQEMNGSPVIVKLSHD